MGLITRIRVCSTPAMLYYRLAQNGEEGYIESMSGEIKPLEECANGYHRYVSYNKNTEYVETHMPYRVKLVSGVWRGTADVTARFTNIVNNDIKNRWSTLPVKADENGNILDIFCFESRNDAILFRFKITG